MSDIENKHTGTVEVEEYDSEKRPEVFESALHEVIAVAIMLLAPAASSIVNGAYQISMPITVAHFGITGGSMAWATGSAFLGTGSFVLLLGSLADVFGRRNSIIMGYSCYAIFALIGGFMTNFIALCVMRAIQGMSIAAGTPAAAGMLGATYRPGRRKNLVLATFSAGAPLGNCIGFIVGGICCRLLSWRAIHFFMAILYGSLAIFAYFFVPHDKQINWSMAREIFPKLDYLGAFMAICGFSLLAFSLTQADAAPKGWRTPYILALLIVGLFLILSFGTYEAYIPKRPLVPMHIFRDMNFLLTMGIVAMAWMEFYGILTYYAIQYFEKVLDYSAIKTTACLLTMTVVGIAANAVVAFTFHLVSGRVLMVIGTSGFLGAAVIWETMDIHRNYWLGPFWGFSLTVIGGDIVYNVANMVTLNSVTRELQSSAAGVFNTMIQFSGVIGLAASSALVAARNPYYGTEQQDNHVPELFDGFKNAYLLATGCGATAVLLSLFLRVGKSGS